MQSITKSLRNDKIGYVGHIQGVPSQVAHEYNSNRKIKKFLNKFCSINELLTNKDQPIEESKRHRRLKTSRFFS